MNPLAFGNNIYISIKYMMRQIILWYSVLTFCESVLSQKEAVERGSERPQPTLRLSAADTLGARGQLMVSNCPFLTGLGR